MIINQAVSCRDMFNLVVLSVALLMMQAQFSNAGIAILRFMFINLECIYNMMHAVVNLIVHQINSGYSKLSGLDVARSYC